MTKIKIIKGVFGYKQNNSIIPKDKKSEPFEVDDTTAQRLIKTGVAELAGNVKSAADKPVKYTSTKISLAPENTLINKTKESNINDNAADVTTSTTYSMENTQKELLEMAKELGFSGSDKTTKAELIEFLDNTAAGEEDAPQIDNNAGVVA